MGDRANICILDRESETRVFLYTHWNGTELYLRLAEALERKVRWDDGAYLTRIIFDAMTDGQHGEETGFGIAGYMPDNSHPILVVDCDNQLIHIAGPDDIDNEPKWRGPWKFDAFIETVKLNKEADPRDVEA